MNFDEKYSISRKIIKNRSLETFCINFQDWLCRMNRFGNLAQHHFDSKEELSSHFLWDKISWHPQNHSKTTRTWVPQQQPVTQVKSSSRSTKQRARRGSEPFRSHPERYCASRRSALNRSEMERSPAEVSEQRWFGSALRIDTQDLWRLINQRWNVCPLWQLGGASGQL